MFSQGIKINMKETAFIDFKNMVSKGASEREIHSLMKDHRWLIDHYVFGCTSGISFCEYQLNTDYRCDFLALEGSSYPNAKIIELKSPGDKLFTAKGTMSAPLNDAFMQCANQLCCVSGNPTQYECNLDKSISAMQKYAPITYEPLYFEVPLAKHVDWHALIIIGDDTSLDVKGEISHEGLNHLFGFIKIRTYASIVRHLEKTLEHAKK